MRKRAGQGQCRAVQGRSDPVNTGLYMLSGEIFPLREGERKLMERGDINRDDIAKNLAKNAPR